MINVIQESFLVVYVRCVSDKCDTRDITTFSWDFKKQEGLFLTNRLEIFKAPTHTPLSIFWKFKTFSFGIAESLLPVLDMTQSR